MKVSELAKQYEIEPERILETLRSLRLKAKDQDQEISEVVVSVVRDAMKKQNINPVHPIEEPPEEEEKKPKVKKVAKKKQESDAAVSGEETKEKQTGRKKKTDTASVAKEQKPKQVKKAASKEDAKEKKSKVSEEKDEPLSKESVALKEPKHEIESKPVEQPIHKEEKLSTSRTPVARDDASNVKSSVASGAAISGLEDDAESLKNKKKLQKDSSDKDDELLRKKNLKSKDSFRSKFSIVDEPVITLKPLSRKKKKVPAGAIHEHKPVEETHLPPQPGPLVRKPDEPLVDLEISVPISVKDLSVKIQQKPSVVLTQLMKMGVMAHINQALDVDVVHSLVKIFGFNYVKIKTQEQQLIDTHKKEEEDVSLLKFRAPVVTFMGHVDHGKTSLIDKIRKTRVADTEHGGITQHMGAYCVELPKGRITFLDTPGHEAFTAMRARGAHITDIVVLVVAADEGVMPQTEEAIDHARAANVPIVVALNKIDKKTADIDKVKKQLANLDLMAEDWGGKTIVVGVSAHTGAGINDLLEMLLLEAEMLELKANPNKRASGIVVEAHMSQGKGAVTSIIVQSGTLKEGDYVVVGQYYGKVRAMLDDAEKQIKEAGPSMPAEILGLPDVPEAGDLFYVVGDEKQARDIVYKRREEIKNKRLQSTNKITLEDLYSQIEDGRIKEVNVILKADVQGSVEALKDMLGKLPSDKVRLKFVHTGVGDVTAADVVLAYASSAIIIAFHVDINPRAKVEIEKTPVEIRQYRIIYDALNDMKMALEGMLEAKIRKKFISRVEIRQIFKLTKSGTVAGCYVLKGKVKRKDHLDLMRDGKIIYSGTLTTLKRFKDDVKEVTEGMECGISFDGFDDYQVGDIIEFYDIEKIAQKL